MRDFKVRKIREKRRESILKKLPRVIEFFKAKKKIIGIVIATLVVVFLFGNVMVSLGIFQGRARQIFSLSSLSVDKYGHTNILFLGVGGKNAEGGYLSDSIMVVSIDSSRPSVSMLSLPRDLFLPSDVGSRKLNEVYAVGLYENRNSIDGGAQKSLKIIDDAVTRFTDLDIHYTVVVDFSVFQEAVDLVGGVDIFVPQDIEDPFYPTGNYGYETFVVRRGLQHFDGTTALKYARSRKTSSDYDRARRQQDLVLAIRKKIEDLGWAGSAAKIKEFYGLFKSKVNTDLTLVELIELGKVGMGIDSKDVVSCVLNDDPFQKGGLLYPPAKELYGGQFVLLPKDPEDLKRFVYLNLDNPKILLENAQISIKNASKIEGRAADVSARLRRFGFHVLDIGNYTSELPVTRSFFKASDSEKFKNTLNYLKDLLEIGLVVPANTDMSENGANLTDIEVVLGEE